MNAAKPRLTSATSIPIAWPTAAVAEHSVEQTVVAQPPSVHPVVAANGLAERIVGRLPTEPWQNKADDKRSNLWQAVAQRRRMHRRHTNQSLGVCSLALIGPHEATPLPGFRVGSTCAHYFMVLTVKFKDEVGAPPGLSVDCGAEVEAPEQ